MLARGFQFVLLCLAWTAGSALAFETKGLGWVGSLWLSDIEHIVGATPDLKREVAEALARVKKEPDDIFCIGMRFPTTWINLGGARVSPYTCYFDDKSLEIKTTVRITGHGGKVFDRTTPEARRHATDISETNPVWKWGLVEPEKND